MRLKFCGAARAVTGSCHMIMCESGNILVDCGMRQGEDAKQELGEGGFAFDPHSIAAVLVTHAHIDHTGLLPLLVKGGFTGPIVATGATARLSGIMLPDSGHIQEMEAEYTNRKRLRAGKPPIDPLYTVKDAAAALKQYRPVEYETTVEVIPGVTARFNNVGHLLGSAAIEVWVEEKGHTTKLVFSGDLGRDDRPIIQDPETVESADYLIVEGTYGDRHHGADTKDDKERELQEVLAAAIARGGNIVFPSFAIGRTQELLYYIKNLINKRAVQGLERIPVYIDSPLGIEATKIYQECAQSYYDKEALEMAAAGDLLDFPTLRVAKTSDESKLINVTDGAKIIISSSGMCDAGRIRHHLKHNLYRADSTVVFMGYQSVGTLGRILVDGASKVKLFGEEVRVNANIVNMDGFSGHADKDEIIDWVRAIPAKPKRVFAVHGEEEALNSLSDALRRLGYSVDIPSLFDEADLEAGVVLPAAEKRARPAAQPLPAADEGLASRFASVLALLDSLGQAGDAAFKRGMIEKDMRLMLDKWEELLK